jgi:hypothetical protein
MIFEDSETVILELKRMIQSIYTWIVAWNTLLISNFSEFLKFCSFFFYILEVFLYIYCVLRLRLSTLLINLHYIYMHLLTLEGKVYIY